jgi:ribosome maturation factor RimP
MGARGKQGPAARRAAAAPSPGPPEGGWEAIPDRVAGLMLPLLEPSGVELVHVEFGREAGGRVLRLYVDKPGGITLEDCAWISRQAGDLLDVYLEGVGAYHLEVSSPGRERPLGKRADYLRFRGQRVRVRTAAAIGGRRNFSGILLGLEDEQVRLGLQEGEIAIPLTAIRRARLAGGEAP